MLSLLLWAKPKGLSALLNAMSPKSVNDYYVFVEESIANRQRALKSAKSKDEPSTRIREDMFHYLCEAKDPETGGPAYSDQELRAEANLLIIAGSDTTSIQLSSFFFYLCNNERAYNKVVTEIRKTFVSLNEIRQGTKLASCVYLRACLDEAMRLTPPGPSELGRLVLTGGQIVDGDFYPAGTEIGASLWSSARHEDLGDPFVYRPERWIPDPQTGVTEEDVRKAKSYVQPFIAGPTNCVGQNLAMLELLITVARTLWRYDARIAPGTDLGGGRPELGWGRRDRNQYMIEDAFTSMRDGPMVQFKQSTVP